MILKSRSAGRAAVSTSDPQRYPQAVHSGQTPSTPWWESRVVIPTTRDSPRALSGSSLATRTSRRERSENGRWTVPDAVQTSRSLPGRSLRAREDGRGTAFTGTPHVREDLHGRAGVVSRRCAPAV